MVSNALRLNLMKPYDSARDRKIRQKPAPAAEENNMETQETEETDMKTTLNIEGMMCQHCVAHVKKALEGVPGVEAVEVSLEGNNAVVTGSADVEAMKAAVADAGYEVTGVA